MFGTANTYGTLVGVIADKKGYSDSDASVFGGTFIFGGIIGSGVLGTFVESTQKYKLSILFICAIALSGQLSFIGTLDTGLLWPAAISAFLLGFVLAILPVGIDFAVETTFPVPEPISTGLIMSFSQIIGII